MKALMGFGGFDSTKGKTVVGADAGAAQVNRKRQYTQYMNKRFGHFQNKYTKE
jgi:U4/U6.U5 tri-snRNP-associated protein 3